MRSARWILFPLALAAMADGRAQEALPSVDPPGAVAQLARYTRDFRKDKIGRRFALTYPSGQRTWALVHACVRRDAGRIKAMKQSLGRDFKGADRDPWRAYGLALEAYHLGHAGEFPKHLADELLVYLGAWDREMFRGLDADRPFADGSVPCLLPTAACAAALAGEGRIPDTHRRVREALDGLRASPPSQLVHLNATLQAALVTGRITEFRNGEWRRSLGLLRDTLPPDGFLPVEDAFPGPASVFADLGAALRIGAVVFDDSSFLYAANKFQAAAMTEAGNPGRFLSPLQWAYLSYEKLDAMKIVVPPARAVAEGGRFVLRTGNHPRAAFLRRSGEASGLDFRAGGSRLGGMEETFLVDPAPTGKPLTPDPAATRVEDDKGDSSGVLEFAIGKAGGARLSRQLVLTREGILLIADRVDGDRSLAGRRVGPRWPSGAGVATRGANWFATRAAGHFLPPGYRGDEHGALVWFAPRDGAIIEAGEGSVAQTAEGREGRLEFLTVVVPFRKGLRPDAIAGAITSEGPGHVRVGRMVFAREGGRWIVTRG